MEVHLDYYLVALMKFKTMQLSLLKEGSFIETESCSQIIIRGSGKLIIESQSNICISEGTKLDFENGQQNFLILGDYGICGASINFIEVVPPQYNISTYEDWTNKNYNIDHCLTVENGGELILNNTQLNMNTEEKIIVNAGAKLVVNNTILTNQNSCGITSWQGITVLGNSNLDQQVESNQGVLEITNGAIIEKAGIAVFVGDPEIPWGTQNGGIIKINGAIFRDNITDIAMPKYHNFVFNIPELITSNRSYIMNSQFITTDYPANMDIDLYAHI